MNNIKAVQDELIFSYLRRYQAKNKCELIPLGHNAWSIKQKSTVVTLEDIINNVDYGK